VEGRIKLFFALATGHGPLVATKLKSSCFAYIYPDSCQTAGSHQVFFFIDLVSCFIFQ